ncbi:hypothetical protein HDU97_006371 [Phlyctochytrium planicorne]|nr:hypothetical protein HDU97_006371 [Phlyctochytrium planicorne]
MSFNIRYGTADDGPNHWNNRKDLLVKCINKYDPAILCLQEALDFQISYIMGKSARSYAKFGVGREFDFTGESVAILVDSSEIQVSGSGTFWLSDQPTMPGSKSYGNHLPRIATWIKFRPVDSSVNWVHLVNVHLDHESRNARVQGVKQVLEFIPRTSPAIVTGDFNNNSLEDPEITEMKTRGCLDTFKEIHNSSPPTFHGFTGRANEKIDFIWRRGEITTLSAGIVTDSENGRFPSDHFALTARLQVK